MEAKAVAGDYKLYYNQVHHKPNDFIVKYPQIPFIYKKHVSL